MVDLAAAITETYIVTGCILNTKISISIGCRIILNQRFAYPCKYFSQCFFKIQPPAEVPEVEIGWKSAGDVVQQLKEGGMDTYDIPAFLRNQMK